MHQKTAFLGLRNKKNPALPQSNRLSHLIKCISLNEVYFAILTDNIWDFMPVRIAYHLLCYHVWICSSGIILVYSVSCAGGKVPNMQVRRRHNYIRFFPECHSELYSLSTKYIPIQNMYKCCRFAVTVLCYQLFYASKNKFGKMDHDTYCLWRLLFSDSLPSF